MLLITLTYRGHTMQKRTNDTEKIEIVGRYTAGESTPALAAYYGISSVAIQGLLRRRGVVLRDQAAAQRKYPLKEDFFDNINTQEKAYFLGLLYADGNNSPKRNSVNISLQEKDKHILEVFTKLTQPLKPLHFVPRRNPKHSDNFRMCLCSKHMSEQLTLLGCTPKKTHTLTFPEWLDKDLVPHFLRGYWDGDGWIGERAMDIVGTESFVTSVSGIFKSVLNVNSYVRTRHPERNHNIRTMVVSGKIQCLKVLDWLYKDTEQDLYLKRKYARYLNLKASREAIENKSPRQCVIEGCNNRHCGKGFCRNHYYEYCGGKERRLERYINTGR